MKVVLTPQVAAELTGIEVADPITWGNLQDKMWGPVGTPERDRIETEFAAYRCQIERIDRATKWLERVPFVGHAARTVWYLALENALDGPRGWWARFRGSLEFAFLNDGIRPSLWYVWRATRGRYADDPGLYVLGNPVDGVVRAPRNSAEAALWNRLWAEQRQ